MHLTQLTVKGFKSFASATTMKLEPGITCVVGPNGSGKSNVVDALSWVMGEQGAKTLRGGKMEDVIFAGTSTRQPLGRAEVSLTIDNADGVLPIDYSEVTISRTLFRAGGSEYAINGQACRLLDIQELLSDTGMGREMHVIVGQGRLDSVLQATPEDRRGFVEEAAGVLKHRRRKEKALRKLDAMAGNLARVADLTQEIRRQLGPLARQAAVARRAQVIQAEARDARLRILADDLVQAISVLEQDAADMSAMQARQAHLDERLASLTAQLTAAEAEATAAAPELAAATDAFYALTATRERIRSLTQLASERVRNLATPIAVPSGRDPEDLERRADEAQEAEETADAQVQEATAALAVAGGARSAAEDAERAVDARVAALHRGAADRREGLARLTGQVGAKRSRLEAVQDEAARRRADIAEAREAAERASAEFAALEKEAAVAQEGGEGLDAAHEDAVTALEEARAAVEEILAERAQVRSRLVAAEARRDALALSLERRDATGELLAAAADDGEDGAGPLGRVRGVHGALPDHVHVTSGWEDAVAAVLDRLVDAALVAGPEASAHAVDALRQVRDAELGHVRLVLADPAGVPGPAVGCADLPAAALALVDLVEVRPDAPDGLGATLRALLAGAVAVEGLTEAREVLAATDPPAVTACVTRTGDVVARTWAAGGGEATPSVLQIRAAHDDAAADHAQAATLLADLEARLIPAKAGASRAQEVVDARRGELREADARNAAVAERLGRLGVARRAAQDRVTRAEPAVAKALADAEALTADLADLQRRLEEASAQPETTEADLAAAEKERARAAEAARTARAAETDARLTLRTAEERANALRGRARSLRAAAAQERDARRRAAEKEARRERRAAVAGVVLEGAGRLATAVDAAVERAAAERDLAQEARRERNSRLARLRAERDEVAAEAATLRDAAHREEVARAEQRLRVDHLRERAIDQLGVDPDVLVEEYGPHLPVPDVAALVVAQQAGELDEDGRPVGDPEAAPEIPAHPFVREVQEKRLVKAEKDLARLGKVNPLALEEHAALEERHTFLTQQLADLERSRDDLLGIVRDIDARVEQVFREAYEDTAREFVGVFSRLFPGGEGRLVLTDPDDMLTTGIEVEARPAGKKVKRLSLLSGGERSLTAVALLVAIFKARPSPFYVMDEVEAALDDVNLGRLLEIFRELQESSQLIVITHQKRTMEIADALYGITMRDGVTQVISQRVEREDPAD